MQSSRHSESSYLADSLARLPLHEGSRAEPLPGGDVPEEEVQQPQRLRRVPLRPRRVPPRQALQLGARLPDEAVVDQGLRLGDDGQRHQIILKGCEIS